MSAPDRRAMVERPGKDLSVRRQCVLLSLTRSGVYRSKPVTGADDLAVMRRIDELHELCGKLGCAPKACIISGGRFHPESCRLIW